MPFAISPLLQLIRRWYGMRQFNAFGFQQIIKYLIAFSRIKRKSTLFLPDFRNQLERITSIWFARRRSYEFSSINISILIVRIGRIRTKHINMTIGLFTRPRQIVFISNSAFISQSLLQYLVNIIKIISL